MEALSVALIIAIGWALSYRAKWRRAEQLVTHWRSLSEHQARCLVAKTEEFEATLERLAATEAALHKAVAAEWPRGAA